MPVTRESPGRLGGRKKEKGWVAQPDRHTITRQIIIGASGCYGGAPDTHPKILNLANK